MVVEKNYAYEYKSKQNTQEFYESWGKVKVKSIGFTYGGLRGKSKSDFENGNKLYITFLNIMNNTIIKTSELRYVRVIGSESQNRVNVGDLLFNTSSETPEEVGMCSVLLDKVDELYLNSFCFGFRIYDENLFDPLYLTYFFRSNEGRKLFFSLAQGATRYNLSKNLFYDIEFKHPEIQEQKAIAEVLFDTDNLIETFEKLIDKKKKIKQGAMQQLLTGKKRLPGFSGEWRKVKVKDIGYAYGGLSGKSKSDFDGGNKPYITFLNVMNNTIIEISSLRYVRVKSSESQNRVNTGDLLFNTSSETPEEVGMCSVLLGEIDELYLNSFCFGFRIYDQNLFEPLYLAYFFRSNEGRKLFFSLAQGATRYNLSKNLFYNIEFKHPSIQEQKAIAQVLSDMDNEIEALEEKLEKYKTIKQGMMQELLTGRIRLI